MSLKIAKQLPLVSRIPKLCAIILQLVSAPLNPVPKHFKLECLNTIFYPKRLFMLSQKKRVTSFVILILLHLSAVISFD